MRQQAPLLVVNVCDITMLLSSFPFLSLLLFGFFFVSLVFVLFSFFHLCCCLGGGERRSALLLSLPPSLPPSLASPIFIHILSVVALSVWCFSFVFFLCGSACFSVVVFYSFPPLIPIHFRPLAPLGPLSLSLKDRTPTHPPTDTHTYTKKQKKKKRKNT